MNEHPNGQPADESDQQADETVDLPAREEFGVAGIEFAILVRYPGGEWDLDDGEVYSDAEYARGALSRTKEYLAEAAAERWQEMLVADDADFTALAMEYERLKCAEVALFARAVSSFVRA